MSINKSPLTALAIACLAFVPMSANATKRPSVAARECTSSESRLADDDGPESLKDWDAVHVWYRRWARCDDGGIAEGVSESVTVLLARHWTTLQRLAELGQKDQNFIAFVVRHVDDTVPADRLKLIIKKSQTACPAGQRRLCKQIEHAAR
jgi:hypothetical protein